MFDYFKSAKRLEIKALERLGPGRLPRALPAAERPSFNLALKQAAAEKGLAVIAEYKRASPSQGDIAPEVSPARAAADYAAAGAAAISVLTEKSKFKGRLAFIDQIWSAAGAGLPLLRKDFIFHPLQIRATASTRASALLLIVKLTPSAETLRSLMDEAGKYGLQCVVEVVDQDDLNLAREAGAEIIQVNARDFNDLSVDLSRSLNLAEAHYNASGDELWIAASGLSEPQDLVRVREAGFSAALIGTALMKGGRPADSLKNICRNLS